MSIRDMWLTTVRAVQSDAVSQARAQLAQGMYIAPYFEVTHPVTHNKGRGDSYSIFFGEWRFGWWETRAEACGVAEQIEGAIGQYPIDVVTDDA